MRALAVLALFAAADDPKPAELKLSADEQAVVDKTNAERRAAGVPELKASAALFEAARAHAANMAKQENLTHTLDGKDLADRVKAAGYAYKTAGENIGWNYAGPKEAVAGWMASADHKKNLLSAEFTEVGVAVATSANGEPYWVQVFAAPKAQ